MAVTTDNLKTLLSEETTGLQVPAGFESKFKGKDKYTNRDMIVQAAKEGIIDELPPIYKKTIIEKAAAEINKWTDAEFPKDKSDSGKIAVLYLYTILTGKSQDPNVAEVLKVGKDLRTATAEEAEEIKKAAAERAAVPKIETMKIKKIDATSAIPPIVESGSKESTPTVSKAKNKTISRKQITKEFNEVGELVNFTKTKEGKEKGTRKDILVTTAINSVEADTDDIIRALTTSKTKEITENPANPQEAPLVTSLETNKLLDNYTIIRK